MLNLLSWIIFFPFKLLGKLFSGLWSLLGWCLFANDMNHRKK